MKRHYGLFGLLFFLSCSQQTTKVLTIKGEKDLIPEGISIYNNHVLISSILKNKIVEFFPKEKKVENFILSKEYNFGSGVGIFVKDSLLFALSNSSINANEVSKPSLYIFNIPQKKFLKKYELDDKKKHFWNDLTVNSQNEIFISDTRQDNIYKIKYAEENIMNFYSDTTTIAPNGIDLSTDGKRLFIASTKYGVRILDLNSKTILNKVDTATVGIDGLKYYKGSVFAIRNSDNEHSKHRLLLIRLSKQGNTIEKVEHIFVRNDLWNVPTTLDINNELIYFLANSQMDNLDQSKVQIIDKSKLTDTYILKIKIKKRWINN